MFRALRDGVGKSENGNISPLRSLGLVLLPLFSHLFSVKHVAEILLRTMRVWGMHVACKPKSPSPGYQYKYQSKAFPNINCVLDWLLENAIEMYSAMLSLFL